MSAYLTVEAFRLFSCRERAKYKGDWSESWGSVVRSTRGAVSGSPLGGGVAWLTRVSVGLHTAIGGPGEDDDDLFPQRQTSGIGNGGRFLLTRRSQAPGTLPPIAHGDHDTLSLTIAGIIPSQRIHPPGGDKCVTPAERSDGIGIS